MRMSQSYRRGSDNCSLLRPAQGNVRCGSDRNDGKSSGPRLSSPLPQSSSSWSTADLRHFAQQTRAWRFYLPMGSEIFSSSCVENAEDIRWVCELCRLFCFLSFLHPVPSLAVWSVQRANISQRSILSIPFLAPCLSGSLS